MFVFRAIWGAGGGGGSEGGRREGGGLLFSPLCGAAAITNSPLTGSRLQAHHEACTRLVTPNGILIPEIWIELQLFGMSSALRSKFGFFAS